MMLDNNLNSDNNILKSKVEFHSVEAKDTNYQAAVNTMLYKLRAKIAEDTSIIIIKMEAISFILNSKEPISSGGKLFRAFNKDKEKHKYLATIGVEIKYLDVQ